MALPTADYTILPDPVYEDSQIKRYATDDPTLYIESFEPPALAPGDPVPDFSRYIEIYSSMRDKLMEKKLHGFIPEIVDYDVDEHWVAFGIPEGGYRFSEILKSFPYGIDGRDWAWIFKRVLMVLQVSKRRPDLREENFLVYPEQHGVVLLGWHPIEGSDFPLDQLKALMDEYLSGSVDSFQQKSLVENLSFEYKKNRVGQLPLKESEDAELFSYDDALREHMMKLERLYGPPKFHPMAVDPALSTPYLLKESESAGS